MYRSNQIDQRGFVSLEVGPASLSWHQRLYGHTSHRVASVPVYRIVVANRRHRAFIQTLESIRERIAGNGADSSAGLMEGRDWHCKFWVVQ